MLKYVLSLVFVLPLLAVNAPPLRAQAHPERGELECLDCHSGLAELATVHAPVRSGDCTLCHTEETETGAFHLAAEGSELCSTCHSAELDAKFKHSVLEVADCMLCHDPHQSAQGRLLTAPSGELCSTCHSDVVEDKAFLHGPAAAGACVACHDPHGADRQQLLVVGGNELCLQCHVDMEERLQSGKTVHAPVADDCTTCHDPHGAALSHQLTLAPPDLCVLCHDSVSDEMGLATSHEPVASGKACINCHDPHVTDHGSLLRADGKTLCLSCHNAPLEAPTRTLADMQKLLDENPDHHGPIREDDCSSCHRPHGSDEFSLLAADYPKDFYTPFAEAKYELCFTCHDPELVRDPETTTLTGFRDGARNLHYLHVNRPDKGRTCRACHETHASTNPFHIRTSVPFGKWEMPLQYSRTADGGSCLPGCHGEKAYSRTPATEGSRP